MRVLVLHAYSRHNAGDGWLVAWSVELIREALGADVSVDVLAMDPESFASWDNAAVRGITWRSFSEALRPAGRDRPDLIVGVGGGYLRGRGVVSTSKMLLAHGSQLRLAAKLGDRVVYLPQSIGPLNMLSRPLIRRFLAQLRYVFVRDDRSVDELHGIQGVRRVPDLALLQLGASNDSSQAHELVDEPVWVVRKLRGISPSRYLEMSGNARFAIQSEGRGNDDRTYCEVELGVDSPPALAEVLRSESPRVIVSVRLHGALLSLLAGWPTVHLSYERKGFGAFSDLGLDEYVESVYSATPATVAAKIARIHADPSAYWKRVTSALPALAAAREEVTASLRLAATHPELD
jgi:polysaccharide pyruvyl transferase WcaK-like protein